MIALRYRESQSGKYSVYLDIRTKDVNGKPTRRYEFLRIYVSKNYSATRRILKEDEEKMELARSICSKMELELNGNVKGLAETGKRVNLSLIGYIQDELNKTKRDSYKFLIQHLQGFNKGKDILISDVSLGFIEGFAEYLEGLIARNTEIKYLRLLKKFISNAFKDEIILSNPFTKYEMPHLEEVERGYLTLAELKVLNETPTWFEEHIRHGFLFSCFTGLRYSDVLGLETNQIQQEKNSEGVIHYSLQMRPKKTTRTSGKLLQVPLSQQAVNIFQSVKKTSENNRVFSRLPSKDMCNYYIMNWAKQAGIKKNIHFHLARHTFATLSLTSGIDIYTVSKLLGHSHIDATQVYAKIIDEKKKEEIKKFPKFL